MLIIITLLFVLTHATFTPKDIPGPFLLRRGTSCPNFVELLHDSPSPPQFGQFLVRDQACTSGELVFDDREDLLVRYLSGIPEIGDTLTILVEEALVCEGVTFQPGALFTFVKSSKDVAIDFSKAFGRNDTDISADGEYTFVAGGETLIIKDKCLYSRLNKDEIDRQRGECFPGDAIVKTERGTLPIRKLETGDFVHDGTGWSEIIGWTHRDSVYTGPFTKIFTEGGAVTLSNGHYLYTNKGMRPARDVKRGMILSTGAVTDVVTVVRTGLFNPQTRSGDVVVDGVRCTTYTRSIDPLVAHALLLPVRIGRAAGVDLLNMFGYGVKSL